MNNESKDVFFWNEWRDILLGEFERRLTALGTKAYTITPARKTFAAIFLQVKGFTVPGSGILPEVIKTIKDKDNLQPDSSPSAKEFDAVAMMGHRIGMVENIGGLKQYLLDVRPVLKPEGQILFTALDINAANELEHRSNPALNNLQFQQVYLIGPFFSMLRIKIDTLKNQAAAANWRCAMIFRQDDSNYLARLSLPESALAFD